MSVRLTSPDAEPSELEECLAEEEAREDEVHYQQHLFENNVIALVGPAWAISVRN